MVKTCRENNVAIMVDFIINHLGSSFPDDDYAEALPEPKDGNKRQCGINVGCSGWDGTIYGSRNYACTAPLQKDITESCEIPPSLFHHTIGDETKPACVVDFSKHGPQNPFVGCERCDVSFGADLDTENIHAILKLQDYLLRLMSAGVTMTRIDASMLVDSTSMAYILGPFPWDYNVAEYFYIGGREDPTLRLHTAHFYDYTWGRQIYHQLVDGTREGMTKYRPTGPFDENQNQWVLAGPEESSLPPSEKLLVYIDDHDGNDGKQSTALDYHLGGVYSSAMFFLLFHPWGGVAQIMSSFWHEYHKSPTLNIINKQIPPLVSGQFDKMANLTRPVDAASCRVAPTTNITEDADWQEGKCMENGRSGPCQWICQHRWIGVAALARARKLVNKTVSVENTWWNETTKTFAFSLGRVAWMFMQHETRPEGLDCDRGCIATLRNCLRGHMFTAWLIGAAVMVKRSAEKLRIAWRSN
jgi:hypothetical protein